MSLIKRSPMLSKSYRQSFRPAIAALFVATLSAGLVPMPVDSPISGLNSRASASQDDPNEDEGERRYREGNQLRDRMARFKVAGDRVEFHPSDGHAPLLVLENLALERVKNEVVRVGSNVRWDIIAIVTEYEGDNYVLIQRASLTISVESEE